MNLLKKLNLRYLDPIGYFTRELDNIKLRNLPETTKNKSKMNIQLLIVSLKDLEKIYEVRDLVIKTIVFGSGQDASYADHLKNLPCLNRRRERDIDGNHYLSNLLALLDNKEKNIRIINLLDGCRIQGKQIPDSVEIIDISYQEIQEIFDELLDAYTSSQDHKINQSKIGINLLLCFLKDKKEIAHVRERLNADTKKPEIRNTHAKLYMADLLENLENKEVLLRLRGSYFQKELDGVGRDISRDVDGVFSGS